MLVYLNGSWVEDDTASISIHDRGFSLADGVFETARLVRGRFFLLDEHLDRLAESARHLQLDLPPRAELRAIAAGIVARNAISDGSLRITLTRGRGGRGLATRGAGPPTLLVTLTPIAPDWRERLARGWHLVTARTRRPAPVAVPSDLKALGRVYAILAHLEAENAGVDDALMLTADGYIGEGPTWNFFWRTGRLIRTAAITGGILEGITRSIVMRLAADAGFEVQDGLYTPHELLTAEEAFATMTSFGVVPIRSIDGRPLVDDRCAALLQSRYWDYVFSSLADGPVAAGDGEAGPL